MLDAATKSTTPDRLRSLILARKPSGLCLLRLPCGCEVWARRLADGTLHTGRHVVSCGGRGMVCGAQYREGAFFARIDAAARAVSL